MNLSSERSYNNKNGQQQYFLSVQASKNNQEISSINNNNSKQQDYSQLTQQNQQQPQQYQQFGNILNSYSNTDTRVKQYNNQINNIQEKNQKSYNSNRQELSQSKEYINKELNKNQQYDKNYNNRNQNDNVKYQQQRHTDYIKPSISSAIKNVNLNLTVKTNNKYNYQQQQQQKISNMEPQYRLSERALKTEGDDIDVNYIPGSQKSSHQKTTSLANNLPEESQYSQANQQQNRVFSQFKNITKSLSDKQEGLGSYSALQNQVESQQSIKEIQSLNSLSDSANITNNQQQNQKKFLNVVNIEEKQEEYEENQETQRNQNNTDINHLNNKDSNNKYLNGTQKVYLNQNYTQQKKHNGVNETQVQNFGSFSEKIQNYHSINNVPQNSNQLQLNNQQKYQKINNIDKEQNYNKGEKNLFLQLSKEDQERIYDNLKINCKICSSEMINCNERSPWTCYICNEQNQGIRCSNRIICKNHKDISICSCCQQKLNQNQLVVESMIKQIQKMDQNKQKRLKCQHCQKYLQNFTVQGWNQKWQCSRCHLNKNDLQQIFRMKCENHEFNMCAVCIIQPFIN
ncbi:hypothetical protein PPERSA_10864 [Pseudocohnilembus persalinus]|uniref:Uncharacterized protein n=1 Tax=Pseudocohnilembus persalinus TaxID=266149 RepID=A0A0V0QDT3_PSEPJ|nr:hypothetical protein PPERSA_10864 [Pseudocohnilembus persalinus]|eukprot:KRX00365.1 hypothetical protein PPERSA_10864 [Pseudocohnilembus persalinus]